MYPSITRSTIAPIAPEMIAMNCVSCPITGSQVNQIENKVF
jgi:hypothetical protein